MSSIWVLNVSSNFYLSLNTSKLISPISWLEVVLLRLLSNLIPIIHDDVDAIWYECITIF